ncbi:MAG: VCBS repeat-containing protein, partial [Flammeovirgaceae bacterium]|nr:VCBS repeat-containing protein [Flammeovirgaceae bacterium]
APVQVTEQGKKTIKFGLSLFETQIPDFKLSPPSSTLVKIMKDGGFVIGDAHTNKIYQFSKEGGLEKVANVKEGAVNLIENRENLLITVMGSFSPTDNPSGFLIKLPLSATQKTKKVIDHLQRPVHTAEADLNNDGIMDLVICEYAKWTGGLYWWKGFPDGNFERHLLLQQSGSIKSEITDLNHDGLPDIIALFGQGNEGISVFINQGDETFTEKNLIQFAPTHGSSYFELIDYDNDGDQDMLYACGDNADYKPQLKSYHGIYLYENKGDFKLEKKFFYHLNGAYKATLKDFDQDGDLDLAAISFFPDFENQQEEAFIYAENLGEFEFKSSTFNEVKLGRWIVMDTGDIDLDGDLDIILGSLAFEVIAEGDFVETWVKNGVPFVILENKLKGAN